MSDKKFSVTFKGDGSFDQPWLVFYGDTVDEVQGNIVEAHEKGLFTTIGRASASYRVGMKAGSLLDATTVEVVQTAEEKPAPKAKPAPKRATTERPAPSKDAAEKEEELAPKKAAAKPAVGAGVPKPAWAK